MVGPLFLYAGSVFSAVTNAGLTIKYIGGCEADFNSDGKNDVVLLYETSAYYEITVLLAHKEKEYLAFSLYKGDDINLNIQCKYVTSVMPSVAGKDTKKQRVVINGIAISVEQTESSNSLYYWSEDGFNQVWISD